MPQIAVTISSQEKRILDLMCAYFETSQATVVAAGLVALQQNDLALSAFIKAGMDGNKTSD